MTLRRALHALIVVITLCSTIYCQKYTPEAFGHAAEQLVAANDTSRLDSLVHVRRFVAYRYLEDALEDYFDSGDTLILKVMSQVASSVTREFADSFYTRQVLKAQSYPADWTQRRHQLKLSSSAAAQSRPDSAVTSLLSLSNQFQEIQDSVSAVEALLKAAALLIPSARDERALQVLTKVLAISHALGDINGLARSYYSTGYYYKSIGHSKEAVSFFDSARTLKRELGDQSGLAKCLSSIATVYLANDFDSVGLSFFSEALRIEQEQGDTEEVCNSLLNMISSRHDFAARHLHEWLSQARTYSCASLSRALAARILRAEGIVSEADGNLDSAIGFYQQALTMQKQENRPELEISLLIYIAALASAEGDYSIALKNYLAAKELADSTNNKSASALIDNNLGVVYQKLGDYEQAVSFYRRSLEINDQMKLPNKMVETWNNLAEIYLSVKEYGTASKFLAQSAAVARTLSNRRLYATSLIVLARLKHSTGDSYAALQYLDSALAVYTDQANVQGVFDLHILAAEFLRMDSDFGKARKHLVAAAQLLPTCSSYANIQKYDLAVGQLWYERSRFDSAYVYLRAVIARLETSRRNIPDPQLRSFHKSETRFIYEEIASILYRRYEKRKKASTLDSLVQWFELAKSRTLLDLIKRTRLNIKSKIPPELLAEEESVVRRIEQTEQEMIKSGGVDARKSLLATLSTLDLELSQVRLRENLADSAASRLYNPDRSAINGISDRLPDDRSAILDYLVTSDKSFLIVINRSGKKIYTLASRREITGQLAQYLEFLHNSVKDESLISRLESASKTLAKTVLGGFASDLKQYDKLYISSDGALAALPFEALIVDGKYLIEYCDVSLLPSIQLLSRKHAGRDINDKPRLLAFADPQPNGNITELPYSRNEAEWISVAFDDAHRKILTGAAAAKSFLYSPDVSRYDYIHFATHSSINPDDPSRSKIWLSPDTAKNYEDYLSLADVMKLSFQADLVVLSSCESGGGTVQLGEGIEGFVKGFMYAGCHNVIVSLWEVEDYMSATFMKTFYQNLSLGYAAALRQAKLEMIKSLRRSARHPYYWAPFVLVQGE